MKRTKYQGKQITISKSKIELITIKIIHKTLASFALTSLQKVKYQKFKPDQTKLQKIHKLSQKLMIQKWQLGENKLFFRLKSVPFMIFFS